MEFFSLLFDTESSYQKWQYSESRNRDEYDEVFLNFQMSHIVNKIKSECKQFPDFYLKDFCSSQNTAEYRREIISEIYASETLYSDIDNLCAALGRVKQAYLAYKDSKHKLQIQYQYLHFINLYFICAENIYNIFRECKSKGLRTLKDNISIHQASAEFRKIKEKVDMIYSEFEKIFSINLSFYFSEMAFDTCYEHKQDGIIDKIGETVKKLLDIDIAKEFSIVSNNPFSALDESIAYKAREDFPELFEQLEELFNEQFDILKFIFFELPEQFYFYTGYINFIKNMEKEGFTFCLPEYTEKRQIDCKNSYDLSLAVRLSGTDKKVIHNDIFAKDVYGFVLTGANQGGKTTYLRSVGIIACLANNGLFVPCDKCAISHFDHILTHFNKAEVVGYKKGRLGEEIERFEHIIRTATNKSLVLTNESFASTRRLDGVELSIYFLKKLKDINCLFGMVTHYYEVFDLMNEECPDKVQSLVVMVNKDNSAERLYKVMNLPPNTIAYAHDIAVMCGVTLEQLVYD